MMSLKSFLFCIVLCALVQNSFSAPTAEESPEVPEEVEDNEDYEYTDEEEYEYYDDDDEDEDKKKRSVYLRGGQPKLNVAVPVVHLPRAHHVKAVHPAEHAKVKRTLKKNKNAHN